MTRLTLAAVAVMATAIAAAPLAQAPAQEKSYLVTAVAGPGGPAVDLTAQDLAVTEGGTPRQVLKVERPPFPLVVSLLVDMTQPPPGMNTLPRDLRAAVSSFIGALRATSPNVKIALVEVASGTVTAAGFDAAPAALDAAVAQLFPAHPSDAVILEAMGAAARTMAAMPTPRRAIVTVDINSSESLNEATMKRVTSDLAQAGATVWSVSVRLPRAGGSRREGALNLITKNSGGLRLVANASSGLDALLKQIADSLASQYLVTFARPDQSPVKDLAMTTSRGLKVHISPMSR